MTLHSSSSQGRNWQQQAHEYLLQGNYAQAANLYEQAIKTGDGYKSHYWYLGLMLLLQEQEVEAQTTWLVGMAEGEADQIDYWTAELIQVLETEANRQAGIESYTTAWVIRQHIRELQPTNINNLLQIIDLAIELDNYTEDSLSKLGVIQLIQQEDELKINLILHTLKRILFNFPLYDSSFEFLQVVAFYIPEDNSLLKVLIPLVYEIAYSFNELPTAMKYTEFGVKFSPKNKEILRAAAQFSVDLTNYDQGIQYAKKCYDLDERLIDKIFDNHLIMRSMMFAGGYWEEASKLRNQQETLLRELIKEQPTGLGFSASITRLYNSSFFSPYIQDNPEVDVKLRAQVAQICQNNLEEIFHEDSERYYQAHLARKNNTVANKPLKIGYLSYCLRRHSVGWLARSLFWHHNRDQFEIYAYLLGCSHRSDSLQRWYMDRATQAYTYSIKGHGIAHQIYQDEIDILVDLDSVTLTDTCGIMSLKAAPIQVTWLGWDASGVPTIDYFIADPYVLPDNAETYYSEKIWRLPQTYVAVDGFEIGLPNLRREHLEIPNDAIVYFSAQRGQKYNPNTVRLQMKILKEVPNSYFLIKGFGDQASLNNFLIQIASEEGIDESRLRFLPRQKLEEIHRANLSIVDIALDTYPYNGATTTMETLWMGIPIVTRVGQQFAARNSYTMMMNAGITEGIAWTDEEYIEWGIRLGTDEALRQQVAWKLRKSRQTAPLWNGEQFTREMEKAYQQMWQIYLEDKH